MTHVVDVQVRLHIEESEIEPGDTPLDTAERLVRRNLMLSSVEEIVSVTELVRLSDPGAGWLKGADGGFHKIGYEGA